MDKLEEFTEFLKSVELGRYRKQYAHIKIVEMDLLLPKELCKKFNVGRMDIQAINLLYKVYWEDKNFISFDEFYEIYLKEKKELLEAFRKYVEMCSDCFYKGLKARTYRTWAGLITQIHAGYVAESTFGKGSVQMSRELDSMGADIRVNYKGHKLNYQVKKASFSGVMSRKPLPRKAIEGEPVDIYYEVPNSDIFDNPKTKKGEEESARKSILLAQGKLALREGHKPNSTYINETIKKSGRGLDQLQNEFMKRIRKGEEDHKRNIFDQIINSPTYHNPAINLAIERGDANLAVKLYNEQNKSSAKEGKSDYYKGLADIYSLLGQHGSAKEHYLKYKNALIAEEEKAHNHGYTSAEYSLRRELKGLDEKIENENKAMKKKTLERRASSMVAIAGFGAGIFFLQSNITGNAIADLTAKNTSFIGAGLLVVGLIAGFFWIKSRKK